VYSGAPAGKRFPMILLVHGNFGLGPPYGDQIRGFAKDLAGRGYVTAVPQYYQDDGITRTRSRNFKRSATAARVGAPPREGRQGTCPFGPQFLQRGTRKTSGTRASGGRGRRGFSREVLRDRHSAIEGKTGMPSPGTHGQAALATSAVYSYRYLFT
jgi:Dienelactone hydrolase family